MVADWPLFSCPKGGNSITTATSTDHQRRAAWRRVGGLARTAIYDPAELAKSGQRGLLSAFERQVDPEGALGAEERSKRVRRLQTAHMTALSLKAAKKRTEAARLRQTNSAQATAAAV